LSTAEQAGLVITADGIDFTHPLIRSAIYHDAEPAERRAAHAAIAQAMEPTSAGQRDRRIWHRAAAALSPDADLTDALADLAARNRRATYELWRQVHRRRVYFLAGKEPVRVNLTDDATLTRAWRLDMTTGRIVPSDHTDDVATGDYQRVTELTWLLATENKRRKLKVRGAIRQGLPESLLETRQGLPPHDPPTPSTCGRRSSPPRTVTDANLHGKGGLARPPRHLGGSPPGSGLGGARRGRHLRKPPP
jgi:hypothetical protein